jgi:hypothetical protein
MVATLNGEINAPSGQSLVMLGDYAPCGWTSLFLVCHFRHVPVEWERLKELVGPFDSNKTHSFADLSNAARELGMHPVGMRLERAGLRHVPMPAILQVHVPDRPGTDHLAVLLGVRPDGVLMLDPPYPPFFRPDELLQTTWTGNILVFARDHAEEEELRKWVAPRAAWRISYFASLAISLTLGLGFLIRFSGLGRMLAGYKAGRRSVWFGAAVLLMTASGAVWLVLQSRAAVAHCQISPAAVDLGNVGPGQLTRQIAIHNDGNATLQIQDAVVDCACARVQLPHSVEPGESGLLEVLLNISAGPRRVRLTLHSNDPDGPKTLLFTWRGLGDPCLTPHTIFSEQARMDRPFERTIHLVYPGGRSAAVPRFLDAIVDSPLISFEVGKNDCEALRVATAGMITYALGELELKVTVRPPEKGGMVTKQCRLRFEYGDKTIELPLPVSVGFYGGQILPDVGRVVFSGMQAKDLIGQERVIGIANRTGGELLIKNSPPWLKCEWLGESNQKSHLRLSIVGPVAVGQFHVIDVESKQRPGVSTSIHIQAFVPQL